MRLKSLHIQNFRALEDFKVKKLGDVNLIVGKNNSGKSSVLEAVRIYAGNASPDLLYKIADNHDEKVYIDDSDTMPFEAFFSGRKFPDDEKKSISIGEIDDANNSLIIKSISSTTPPFGQQTMFEELENSKIVRKVLQRSKGAKKFLDVLLTTSADSRRLALGMYYRQDIQEALNCKYVSTQFDLSKKMALLWSDVVSDGKEELITQTLKIIEPDCTRVNLLKNKSNSSSESFVINTNMAEKPIPLNSMGDGMLRIFQLAINAISAKDGFLLIDEFENGLHYSVQKQVWEWLFKLARTLNIQIFATTHSWDCVESFSKVATGNKEVEGVLFRVGRSVRTSDNGKVTAAEFDEEMLANVTQADVEVR